MLLTTTIILALMVGWLTWLVHHLYKANDVYEKCFVYLSTELDKTNAQVNQLNSLLTFVDEKEKEWDGETF